VHLAGGLKGEHPNPRARPRRTSTFGSRRDLQLFRRRHADAEDRCLESRLGFLGASTADHVLSTYYTHGKRTSSHVSRSRSRENSGKSHNAVDGAPYLSAGVRRYVNEPASSRRAGHLRRRRPPASTTQTYDGQQALDGPPMTWN